MTTLTAPKRRGTALLAALVGTVLALTACASGTPEDDAETTPPAASGDGFPITIEAAYGEITIPEKPTRIIALGHNHVDILLSLDEQPIALSAGGPQDAATFDERYPWLAGLYTGEVDTQLVTAEYVPSAEAIAVWEPDLILGDPWMIPEDVYAQLSEIAPVYAGLSSTESTSREDHITFLGAATGKSEQAAQVLADIEDSFASAKDELPGLQGKTYNGFQMADSTFRITNVGTILGDLGLVPAENAATTNEVSNTEFNSLENIEVFGAADVLAVGNWSQADAQEVLEADPRFIELPAYKNNAVLYFDTSRISAGSGPLGVAWLLDGVLDELKQSNLY